MRPGRRGRRGARPRSRRTAAARRANPLGDTYGPVSYLAYIPGYAIFGWSHKWDTLPAVHLTSILFDSLLPARARARRPSVRRASTRGGARVRLGRVAVHAVRVELEHQRRDRAGVPDLGVRRRHEPGCARGCRRARRAGRSSRRSCSSRSGPATPMRAAAARDVVFAAAFAATTAARLLRPASSSRRRCTQRACSTTARSRSRSAASRRSRSGTGGSTTPRASPTCTSCSACSRCCSSSARSRSAAWPRRRSPLRLAALTGAVLVGFELVLTHWFYLYLPWFFPFVALALIAPLPGAEEPAPRRSRMSSRRGRAGCRLRTASPRRSRPRRCSSSLGARAHAASGRTARSSTGRPTRTYGEAIRRGSVPYRDFAVEYPPGRCRSSSLPSCSAATTRRRSRWLMAACGSRSSGSSRCVEPAGRVLVALAPVLVGSLILSRFDLWPVAARDRRARRAARRPARARLGACSARRWRRSSGRSCSCRSRSSGRSRHGRAPRGRASARRVLAVAVVPVRRRRAARAAGDSVARPGLAAAADRVARRRRC